MDSSGLDCPIAGYVYIIYLIQYTGRLRRSLLFTTGSNTGAPPFLIVFEDDIANTTLQGSTLMSSRVSVCGESVTCDTLSKVQNIITNAVQVKICTSRWKDVTLAISASRSGVKGFLRNHATLRNIHYTS